MVVMKAMGMESDQEVVQMIGRDPRYSALLLPSIEVEQYMIFIVLIDVHYKYTSCSSIFLPPLCYRYFILSLFVHILVLSFQCGIFPSRLHFHSK